MKSDFTLDFSSRSITARKLRKQVAARICASHNHYLLPRGPAARWQPAAPRALDQRAQESGAPFLFGTRAVMVACRAGTANLPKSS